MLIVVRDAGARGRGLFALTVIRQGQVIELAPIIEFDETVTGYFAQSDSGENVLAWRVSEDGSVASAAVACGLMMMCNHSSSSNAKIEKHFEGKTASLVATRDIAEGEEVTLRYFKIKTFQE